MSAQSRIDIERRLVATEVWNECSAADIEKVYRALRADPAFVPTFGQERLVPYTRDTCREKRTTVPVGILR